ncbi:unnamed protein product [Rotaria sp. Silwood1]|nr:unnamed protein product [Rotaria sp. Silwood1]CAF1378617.1 unnamed protein product [Rotaria sp. Silwood1]CAF3554956.1 unnamed protein product [Rotaria sp. Silwood1]CAF4725984.1 unnamed protein product [Rotaria sp. Silwood1]
MSTNDDNIHLLPLDDYNDFENSSNKSENDSIEVVIEYSSSDDELEINGDDHYSSVLNVDNNRSLFDDINKGYSTLHVVNRCPTLDLNNKHSLFDDTNENCAARDDTYSQFNSDASNDDDELEYHALNISSTSLSSHPSLLATNTIASSNNGIKETSKRAKLSLELKHNPPSCEWYYRFMKLHRLSLQCPKRQQKIPLIDAYKLVSSFHSYIRRASKWDPRQDPMGAFTQSDICNIDESLLQLFGDQGKLSINDIGTPNDIEGNLSDKRFATLILTVFDQDNSRLEPVLIFKVEEYIEKNEPRNKIKLSTSQSRILYNRFTWSAWIRTLKSIVFLKACHDVSYIWTDNSPVSLRSMPGYTFDPTSVECLSLVDDNYDNEERIDIVAEEAS